MYQYKMRVRTITIVGDDEMLFLYCRDMYFVVNVVYFATCVFVLSITKCLNLFMSVGGCWK